MHVLLIYKKKESFLTVSELLSTFRTLRTPNNFSAFKRLKAEIFSGVEFNIKKFLKY